ncbi:cytochrome P450 [Trichoderma citrinoviride]|uniref:Cytochrome P450 n=1 Tax=Trichoderma citrinoviride TaxID=58853 RepID=A0A2T4BFQ4_9HYPO|nr:cytochrome P450 [Trichoderma citrinoviride]PTB68170.1 cytochrome P450 [Trichoderma citrinoviride]
MPLMTVNLSAICLILLFAFLARRIYLWQRLRHIPGPPSAAWTIWWQLSGAMSGRYHERLKEAADTYGPLVRIGPNHLLSVDPDVLRHMSAVRSGYTKGKFYASGKIVPGVDNVVSLRDPAKHKEMRALMTPGFSGKANEGFSFEAALDRQLLSFINLLERKYVSSGPDVRPFDMAEKTQFFALDAIGDISLGQPFGYLDKDQDLYQYNKINATSLPVMNVVSVMPALASLVHTWPLRLMLPKEGDQVGFGRLMHFARSYVERRLDPKTPRAHDMMQAHIDNGMTKNDLIQQVLLSIIAGSNSSAHALRMTLLSLITNPPAYTALLTEIRSHTATTTSPLISWSQTQTLPYLRAVVSEGLRMWPPVAGLGFKTVPPEGDLINGYFVPGGTEIGQGFHGVGRAKAVWGADADVFRPERWLRAEGVGLRKMTNAVDTHFGHGKYSCLGKQIALMELHKAVFELVRRFDFCIVNPEAPIKTTASIFLFASDFWVTITKREL